MGHLRDHHIAKKLARKSILSLKAKSRELAAHPPPILLCRDGTLELLDKGGAIIGMGSVLPFEEGQKKVEPGDKLVIYTDGIVEYQKRQGEFYGDERLHQELQGLRDRPISRLIDGIIDSIMDFGDNNPPQDDVTLLGIEFKGESK